MCAKFEAMRIKKKRERKRTFVKNYVVSKLTGRVNCNLCWRWCHLVAPLSCIICSFIAVRIWRIFFPFSRQRGTLINKKTVIKKALFIYLFLLCLKRYIQKQKDGGIFVCLCTLRQHAPYFAFIPTEKLVFSFAKSSGSYSFAYSATAQYDFSPYDVATLGFASNCVVSLLNRLTAAEWRLRHRLFSAVFLGSGRIILPAPSHC